MGFRMTKLPIIAIDGPSASGKGSIARGLARELGFAHLETGLLYRYVGKQWLTARKDAGDLDIAERIAQKFAENFTLASLDDRALRTNSVAEAASITSAHPPVRAALLELQREFARNPAKFFPSPLGEKVAAKPPDEGALQNNPSPAACGSTLSPKGRGEIKGAILDGRDIATVVCPDAPVQLFVTATQEIRAERRRKELQSIGEAVTYEQVLAEVRARDHRDQTRETAPLKPTAGSVIIDTSNLSAEDAIGVALGVIRRTIPT